MNITFVACGVFENSNLIGNDSAIYLDTGLHLYPKKLKAAVQQAIDEIAEPGTIMLGYGLCGNGLDGIRAGDHTLIIPKMDDCIAMFLGGRAQFLSEFEANPGTYYLTKGWLEAGTHPLAEYEGYVEKYGQETADYLMDQQYRHYSRLAYVAHSQSDLERYRSEARAVAEYCHRWGMAYEEILGSSEFLDELEGVLSAQAKIPESFIVIEPGGLLKQEMFR